MASINTIFKVFFVFIKLLEAAVQTYMGNEFNREWNQYFKGSKQYCTITACVAAVRPSVLVTVKPDNNSKSKELLCTIVHCIFMHYKIPWM